MKGECVEPHHAYMADNYKDTPWWWYVCITALSFIIGLVVVIKEGITLPAWGFVVALLLGILISSFVSIFSQDIEPQLTGKTEQHPLRTIRERNCHQ